MQADAGTLDSPVVGGTVVKPGVWPDAVAVLTKDGGLCTGTLLAADLVLTAGHCAAAEAVQVIVGRVDLEWFGGDVRDVKWSKAYPSWQSSFDVGIVMLEHPVAAKPRAIAQGCSTRKELVRGTMLDVVGFGLTTTAGDGNNTRLHQAKIGVTDAACTSEPACETAVAPGGEFVAGGHGTDACFGDSGGPVYITTASGPALIGVVSRGIASYGEPCGDGGVYVRADQVVKWIETTSGRMVERVACDRPADSGGGSGECEGGDGEGGDGDDSNGDDSNGDCGASGDDGAGQGGCSAGGEAVGGAAILFVLSVLWLLSWRRARRS
ncbi:MAG TPA: trypsin-like serine protease [Kofleriaceae bacterium]|nr:trypsin-like serine protease [Kofleriaceae bacterium]